MTNSGAAQNNLGQLFVDIGVGGVGKTLKALNSVSASFLLTKNAAVQMTKPLINVGKQTLSMAVDVGKLGSTLGLAYKDAYKLQYYFKHMNLNEGLINDIENLSKQFNAMRYLGRGALTGEQQQAFNILGLDPMKYYGGGFDKIKQLINDVQKRTAGMDKVLASNALQGLGLNSEWLYAFNRGIFDLSDALSISNEEIEAAITASEDLNEANLALKRALEKMIVQLTPLVTQYAPKISQALIDFTPQLVNAMTGLTAALEGVFGALINSKFFKKTDNIKNTAIATGVGMLLGGPFGALIAGGATAGLLTASEHDLDRKFKAIAEQEYRPELDKNLRQDLIKNPKYENAYMYNMGLPRYESPYELTTVSPKITITNNISGNNASEIARKTTDSTKTVLESMLNKYQVSNMVGK